MDNFQDNSILEKFRYNGLMSKYLLYNSTSPEIAHSLKVTNLETYEISMTELCVEMRGNNF